MPAGDAKAQRAVEAIAGAAGEHGRPRMDVAVARPHRDGVLAAMNARDANAGPKLRPGGNGLLCEIAIERRAIDDGGAYAVRVNDDRRRLLRMIERGIGRFGQLVE